MLLAGDIQLRFELADSAGTPIPSVQVGNEFQLDVYVRDNRDAPLGVAAAFLDVLYDGTLASPVGRIEHGVEYNLITDGSLDTPGLIDEAGGNATNFPAPSEPDLEYLLFRVTLQADAPGLVTFTPEAPDALGSIFLIFGRNDVVPFQEVDIVGNTLIDVLPSPGGGGEAAFSIQGDQTVVEGTAATFTIGYTGSLMVGQTASIDIALSDMQTDDADRGSLSAAITEAVADTPGVIFDGTTVTFESAGSKNLSFVLETTDDDQVEDAERFRLELSGARATGGATASITDGVALTEITDNDEVITGPVVAYTVALTSLDGDPLNRDGQDRYEIRPGGEFLAHVYVDDLRTQPGTAGGVFAAFADLVSSDPDFVNWEPGSLVINSTDFPNAQSGWIDAAGVVQEAGGGTGVAALGVDPERLLFTVQGYLLPEASAGSQVTLALDPAEPVQGDHNTLVRGMTDLVEATYESETLIVLDEPVAGSAWQNASNPPDVNDDGAITLLDLMLVLDDIELRGMRLLRQPPVSPDVPNPTPGIPGTARYLDVNGDGGISLLDAQAVADVLNAVSPLLVEPTARVSPEPVASPEPVEAGPSDNAAEPSVLGSQLSVEQAGPIVDAAIRQFAAVGLDESSLDSLAEVEVVIDDLPPGQLATASNSKITIDIDASTHGWFVDATPATSEEFVQREGRLVRDGDSAAGQRVDLLTVVAHELAHTLGLTDLCDAENDLMSHRLSPSERVLPDAAIVDRIFAGVLD